MESKLSRVRALLAAGDEVGALRIVAPFARLGAEKEVITRGSGATGTRLLRGARLRPDRIGPGRRHRDPGEVRNLTDRARTSTSVRTVLLFGRPITLPAFTPRTPRCRTEATKTSTAVDGPEAATGRQALAAPNRRTVAFAVQNRIASHTVGVYDFPGLMPASCAPATQPAVQFGQTDRHDQVAVAPDLPRPLPVSAIGHPLAHGCSRIRRAASAVGTVWGVLCIRHGLAERGRTAQDLRGV